MGNFWRIVNEVIEDADMLLLVLDGRLVEETLNVEIENKVQNRHKPLIYVITKSDLATGLERYKSILKPCVFISSKEHTGISKLRDRIMIEASRLKKEKVKVGVLGYPNVGKSSLINALKGKHSARTSILSGYTKGIQKVKAGNKIHLLDTPGVIPYEEKDTVKHSFIGTIDFSKSKEPDLIVMELMQRFPRRIEKHYGVGVDDDLEEVIDAIAVKRKILKKGAKPDTMRMARMILMDWQKGVIK